MLFRRFHLFRSVAMLCFVLLAALLAGCGAKPARPAASFAASVLSQAPSSAASSAAPLSSAAAASSQAKIVSRQSAASSTPTSRVVSRVASAAPAASKAAGPTVTLSIDAGKAGSLGYGMIFPAQQVAFVDGDTAYSLLVRVCKDKKIAIESSKTLSGAYVSGIGGLMEFDAGASSGWVFRLNGKYASFASDSKSAALSSGDRVEWIYTTDAGATEAAGH